jgi:hypothetical protein
MAKKTYDPKAIWEIRADTPAGRMTLYQGPWTAQADTQWARAGLWYMNRRVRRVVADTAVMAMIHGHPDLIELEAYMDVFYVIPGDRNAPENRTADPEVMSAVRRRVPPFDDRTESFYPEGFDPDAV